MEGDWETGLKFDLERINISQDEGPAVSSCKGAVAKTSFELDLVLEKVMDYLTYDDIRPCFTVSCRWRKKAFLEMESREIDRTIGLTIGELEELYFEVKRRAANPLKLVKLNLDQLPLSNALLHETIKLLSPYLDALMVNTGGQLERLFKTLQELPNLSELSIIIRGSLFENDVCKPTYPIQDPITSRCNIFENIRSLSFESTNGRRSNGSIISVGVYLRLSDAFKTFPNLVTLYVDDLAVEDQRSFNGISFAKLKHLRLSYNFEMDKSINKSLSMLAKLGLKLVKLQFKFVSGPGLDRDLLRKFVESQRDTLQHLGMVQVPDRGELDSADHTPNICPFPLNLPHLKTLHVQEPFIKNLTPIFNALPSLEEAKISVHTGFNWNDITPPKVRKSYPNLQVLRVDYMHSSMFAIMSQYFPSLRVLQINILPDNVSQGLFSPKMIPAEDDSEPLMNMYGCKICKQVNISMSNKPCGCCDERRPCPGYPDYCVVDRHQITSKALEHWKEIHTLIAGNCPHNEPGICFIKDKLTDKSYLNTDVDIETLGLQGMVQWVRWEAKEFNFHSHLLRPFNWTFTTSLTIDSIRIPFNNHPRPKKIDEVQLFRTTDFQ